MHHITPVALSCALAAALPGIAAAQIRFQNVSSDFLPIEMLQGRSMDAELTDLDADGRPDLIVASEFGQNVLLLSGPTASFTDQRNALPRGRLHDSEDIAAADFDGDGRPDVVFVAEDDATHELYLQTEPGVFTDASDRVPAGFVANAVLAHDIDDDGDLDLLLGGRGPAQVLLNNGTARFTPTANLLPAADWITQDLELGDLDGDGDPDLVAATEEGPKLLLNDGTGRFTDATAELFPVLAGPAGTLESREADLFDADNDGDLDLIVANVGWRPGTNPANRLMLNDGTGTFTEAPAGSLPDTGSTSLDADAADLDRDGDLDLVIANTQGPRPIEILLNNGTGRFTDVSAEALPQLPLVRAIDVEILDLNNDGQLDLYIANHISADRLLVREGQG